VVRDQANVGSAGHGQHSVFRAQGDVVDVGGEEDHQGGMVGGEGHVH
jgi:hypothetical protein